MVSLRLGSRVFAAFLLGVSAPATAAPLLVGDITAVAPPPSLATDQFTSDDTIHLIHERSGVVLDEPLTINLLGAPGASSNAAGGTETIAPGSRFDVYLLHFDPAGTVSPPIRKAGTVRFDHTIAGLIFTTDLLTISDGQIGAPGVEYAGGVGRGGAGAFRGFERPFNGGDVSDLAEILADRRTLSVDFGATAYADQVRVLVRVPEPTTSMLAGVLAALLSTRPRSGATRHPPAPPALRP